VEPTKTIRIKYNNAQDLAARVAEYGDYTVVSLRIITLPINGAEGELVLCIQPIDNETPLGE